MYIPSVCDSTVDYNYLYNNTLIIIVLKSDYSNGLFGFGSTDSLTADEGDVLNLPVTRERGVSSGVTVTWEVTVQGESADEDFEYSAGELFFAANETQKVS